MVAALSEQERNVLVAEPDQPVTVVDEQTQQVYYLIPAKQFDRLRALLSDEDFQPSEAYPLIAKSAAEAGWADPMMDAYDTTSKRMPNVSRGDDTVDQGDIRRVIGRFSPQLMNQLEQCIHAALDMQ